ncbi:MAG: response regulator transcription factor [Flavipsychrobacter sp.]|nr:response regulator transcription factor [Flavipsychrobacter sp.]
MHSSNIINIAIADDHKIFREGLFGLLSKQKELNVLIQAQNGNDLIMEIEQCNGTKPDICVLDINMPKMNGHETLIQLKKRWPEMRVLMLSMFEEEYTVLKLLQIGAGGYLTKNTDSVELFNAIKHIHKYGFYHSELASNTLYHSLKNKNDKSVLNISDKELQFLHYCCTDMNYAEIGKQMNISTSSAEKCRDNLFEKFNIRTRTCLAVFAYVSGLYYLKT